MASPRRERADQEVGGPAGLRPAFRILLLFTLLIATPLLAVWPKPPYSQWPCSGPGCGDADNCYSYRSFSIDDALQFKGSDKSPRSTTEPTQPYGICSGYNAWCKLPPQLGSVTATVIPGDGVNGPRVQLSVPYDFPNNYCQVYDDGAPCRASVWPPKQTLFSPVTRLTVYSENGEPLAIAPAVFETGTWTPTLDIGCGGSVTFIVEAKNGGEFVPGCTTDHTVRQTITVTAPSAEGGFCNPDRRCADPDCTSGGGSSPPRGGGKPIHFGSGDVSVNIPLFTIAQSPLSLSLGLAYHSSRPMFPNVALPEPLGSGWSHTFNDSLVPVDPQGLLLYRVDGRGHETLYERSGPNQWIPRTPGELRGRETVTLVNGQYRITYLDGTVVAFSGGRWISTADRWGNAITGTYDGANLATVTDSAGRAVTFSYAGARLTSIALPTGETWRFAGAPLTAIYDPIHTGATPWRTITYLPDSRGVARLLHELSDESGAVLEGHEYDALERGRASYAEGGRDRMTVQYNALGPQTARITTELGDGLTQTSEFTFRYQKGRFLTTKITGSCASCSGAEAESQAFTYDGNNRVLTATDGNGHVLRFTYDANGNLLTKTEAAGTAKERTTTFAYELPTWRNFVTRIASPSVARPGSQRVTTFIWSAGETVLTTAQTGWLSGAASEVHSSTTTFDARHREISVDGVRTSVADVSTTAWYADDDPNLARRGRKRQQTNAAGLSAQFDDYDVYGTPRRTVDPNGVAQEAVTDARGRVTAITDEGVPGDPGESAAYVSTTDYDGRDRVSRATMPRGNGTAFEYEDGTNRLLATILLDASGRQVERQRSVLNNAGRPVREEDQLCASPAAVCTSWVTRRSGTSTYDTHNRLSEIVHAVPAGAKTVFTYDPDGLIATVQDENHTTPGIRYTYDALDRLTAVTRTLAGAPGGVAVTRYDYDTADNVISVTDPNGSVTRYFYDDFGRMTRQESPVTGTTVYAYDEKGNLLSAIDARGSTTTHTYDASGRLRTSTSTLGGSSETVTQEWDDAPPQAYGKGRLVATTDPSGSTAYAYDRRGFLRSETKTILGDVYTTRYEHDANGNRSAIVYPSGRRAVYGFDFADRPVSLTGTLGGSARQYVTAADYLPFGPETNRTYGGGLTWQAAYDQRYQLTAFDVRNGAATVAGRRYAYDAAGNITTVADALDARYSRAFAYDDLHRLVRADSGAALWGLATYDYDAAGNRTASALGARVSTFTYRTAAGAVTPQLLSVTEGGRTRAVDYDATGNERQVGDAVFSYSPRNALAQGDGLRYVYDGRGVRVAQTGVSVGPLVTSQPRSQPVCPGAAATLSVTASGAATFQWQSSTDGTSWQDVGGATSRTFSVTPTATTRYRVVVSNAASSTTSDVAILTPVSLATEPASGILYGDLTQDGAVNAADVAALRGALSGSQPLAVPQAVADLDGDGAVTAVDLSLLGGFSGGVVTCLPRFPAFPAGASLVSNGALSSMTSASRIAANQSDPNPAQYFLYSPELSLLAETEILAGGGAPAVAVEYLWFNGVPVAEERLASNETRLTFTDHAGAPFLQTSLAGVPVWRVEYDPFGTVYATRNGNAADQRLRFPGQEYDDQTPEREYNVFRWYRSGWGRYTQSDPLGAGGDDHPYLYALGNPLSNIDPSGEKSRTCCTPISGGPQPFYHCYVEVSHDLTRTGTTYALHRVKKGLGCTFKDDGFDQGSFGDPETKCGDWSENCDADTCVEKEFNNYPRPVNYQYRGRNSNTFAKHVTETCGLDKPDFPAWKTPGWSRSVPKVNPKKVCPEKRTDPVPPLQIRK